MKFLLKYSADLSTSNRRGFAIWDAATAVFWNIFTWSSRTTLRVELLWGNAQWSWWGRTSTKSRVESLNTIYARLGLVARRVAKHNLRKAGIPNFHVIHGDINRPAQLASDLEGLGLDIHDLLHVRSFLDHNRPYSAPLHYARGGRKARSKGAFAHFGQEIPADELEENLVRQLRRWAPYVGRFGLLALELHTLPPELTAANLDKTPAVAYDGTHGFSDQYLVELPIFLDCAQEAGLHADQRFQCKFPPSELATVSINFFTT